MEREKRICNRKSCEEVDVRVHTTSEASSAVFVFPCLFGAGKMLFLLRGHLVRNARWDRFVGELRWRVAAT